MRVIPVLINLVIAVTGLTVIGIGVYGKTQSEPFLDLLRNDRFIFPNMGTLFIIWGVMICVFPFLFSRTSKQESYCTNIKLLVFLSLVFGFVFAILDNFRIVVEKNMRSGLEKYAKDAEKYGKDGLGGISGYWDLVQRDFHCCGVLNYTDWSGVGNFSEGQTPDSCCKKVPEVVGCGLNSDAGTKNAGGCLKKFDDQLLTYIDVMVLIGIILAMGVFCISGQWRVVFVFLGFVSTLAMGVALGFRIGKRSCQSS